MSILHILRTSAFSDNNLSLCLDIIQTEDKILLIDDGCYCLQHPLLKQVSDNQIVILVNHASARGLSNFDTFNQISMDDFVSLTLAFENTITWQ